MKKVLWEGLACGLMVLGVSGMAQGITIYGGSTDVGRLDTILTSTKLGNSGGPDVANWLTDAIGTAIRAEDIVKVSPGTWLPTSDPSAWAYGLQTEDDGIFFIKTGNFTFNEKGMAAGDDVKLDALADHFLYKNLDSMNWAVVSIGNIVNMLDAKIVELFGCQKYSIKSSQITIGKISHIGGLNPVPEAASMLLMGTGLAGLAAARRKKKV